jgi:hypothetical protein
VGASGADGVELQRREPCEQVGVVDGAGRHAQFGGAQDVDELAR